MMNVFKSFVLMIILLLVGLPLAALADGQPDPAPRLRIEPGMHFAMINRMDVDAAERFVVTASDDKTARVWDVQSGELLQVLRPPIGDDDEGRLYAVAISPDGEQVAVAGWTGYEWDSKNSIYIFQRSSGQLQSRIRDLPNVILDLAFSVDGRKLAVALGEGGIRLFSAHNWQELAWDSDYGSDSYSVDFDTQGRVASTSLDGYLRLYDSQLKLLHKQQTQSGKLSFFARFSPDGQQIAVGYADNTAVDIVSAADLSTIRSQDVQGIENGNMGRIAWSQDGRRLYAGGRYDDGQGNPLVVWPKGGKGKRSLWRASQGTVMGMKPLKDGGVLYVSADPALGRLDKNGQVVWKQISGNLEFLGRTARRNFIVNSAGNILGFQYSKESTNGDVKSSQQVWQLTELELLPDGDSALQAPRHSGVDFEITDWESEYDPKLNNQPLPLKNYEMSRSLAIDAKGTNFALGTDWYIRLYEEDGSLRWQQPTPVAWAVNISADDRWVVAALGDGTIRWYEKGTGAERLAFYLHPDEKRWVTWTPEGFYAAAEGAEELIGYHLNQGADQAAEFIRIDQIGTVFNRADLVSKALDDEYWLLAEAALKEAGDIREILNAGLPPEMKIVGGLQQKISQREFELNLTLSDQGGGIGRVEYRINGEVVSSGLARPYAPRAAAGQKGYKRLFSLPNRENTVEAIAYSANNQVASKPVKVSVTVDDPVHREPSLHVLSIGVSEYRDRDFNLNYAADDAVDFAALLQKQGRKLYKSVETEVLLDSEVSLQRIKTAFEDMAEQVQPQDVFVLYLAGHGLVVEGRYHFVPHDVIYENDKAIRANALGEEKLREWLSLIEVSKRMMVIDSCHAGKVAETLAALATPRGMDDKAAISRLMKATGSSVLAAASSKQQAMEGIIENGQGRGLFTHVLLNGLSGKADIIDKDGLIDINELQSYARKRVPELSQKHWKYEQFPMFHLNGQDFPITQVRQ